MARCPECDAEILWLTLAESGKRLAVNYNRALGGPVQNDEDGARFKKAAPLELGFFPHFRLCPAYLDKRRQETKSKRARKLDLKKRQLKLF